MEVTKWLKPLVSVSRIGDSASVQAVTRVNAEQASKRSMRRPTRQPFRGRLTRLGEAEKLLRRRISSCHRSALIAIEWLRHSNSFFGLRLKSFPTEAVYLPQSLMHCLRLSAHRVFSSKLRVERSWNRMRRTHELYAAAQFAVHMDFVVVADDDVVEITAQPTRRTAPKLPDRCIEALNRSILLSSDP